MIIDAKEIESGTILQCRFCIIGGGACGITLARELDGSGLNVRLQENGGFEFEQDRQALYKGAFTSVVIIHLMERGCVTWAARLTTGLAPE
jgi:2-polyprenyl-6-methoxyphenol hydroxylase-like FAD-dependent oxidoreductase